MLCQPVTGRLSDRHGRGLIVAAGGAAYGIVAVREGPRALRQW